MTPHVPGLALGKRPPKNAPALRLGAYLTGTVPAHPPMADHFALMTSWILGANDQFGTCGPTSVANHLLLTTRYLAGTPIWATTSAVFDLYRRSGNPDFDPATGAGDNGVDMQTMLEALLAGGIAGHTPLAFAKVDHTSLDEVRAAEYLFGGVLFGATLDQAQQHQTTSGLWDYSPSPVWGGHAFLSGRYTDPAGTAQDRTGNITWAQVVDATDAFLDQQVDEAWVIVWPELTGSIQFALGVDMAALAADYQALTGRPFPAPVPGPQPGPTPSPVPGPGRVSDAADQALADAEAAWERHPRSPHLIQHMAQAFTTWRQARGL